MSTQLPAWTPANNGAGKRRWFLIRGLGAEGDRVPVSERYHYSANGDLIRYASCASAQRAADKLNAAERAASLVQVYDVATGETREVTRAEAEAAAGLARYARTLGPGTPACGEVERQALQMLRGES